MAPGVIPWIRTPGGSSVTSLFVVGEMLISYVWGKYNVENSAHNTFYTFVNSLEHQYVCNST